MKSVFIKQTLICSLVIVSFFSAVRTNAQTLTLNQKEVANLVRLIKNDPSAAEQFSAISNLADDSINSVPNPIETITSEGRLKGDPLKTATAESLRDMRKIHALALTYRIKNDEKFLKKAGEFLLAWATKNHPTGDPIDETTLDNAFESYDLIHEKLAAFDKSAIENWFREIAKAEINFPKMAKGRITAMNNWNSHRLKIVGEIAWVLNDAELKKYTLDNLKTQISVNLNPDGTSFDFLERDALHYHTYDLEPLLKLAIIIKRNTKIDFYNFQSEKGASIAKSVEFLAPFVSGEKTHAEFVNTKVAFDKARAKNGEEKYLGGSLFDPKEGTAALSLAAWFTPKLLDIVRKAGKNDSIFPNWQSVLNEITK